MGFSAEWSYRQERRMESVTQWFLILEDNDKNSLDKTQEQLGWTGIDQVGVLFAKPRHFMTRSIASIFIFRLIY